MAKEAARYIADLLKRLPKDHPDREILESELQIINNHLEKREAEARSELGDGASFSDEARRAFVQKDLTAIPLTGQSVRGYKELGKRFRSAWHDTRPEFELLPSRRSEVAFIPGLFLPGSNNKTLEQQKQMVEEYSEELKKEIEGVEAIIGTAPDYIELALRYQEETGEYLFGKNYGGSYTRTTTQVYENLFACVGEFQVAGLTILNRNPGDGFTQVSVAPLIVPV